MSRGTRNHELQASNRTSTWLHRVLPMMLRDPGERLEVQQPLGHSQRMKPDRPSLGAFGESVAASFLEARGASVVARNVEVGGGELDLIVDVDGERTVVEVRTARRGDVAPELVSQAKESQVRRLAGMLDPPAFRVDVVTVLVAAEGLRVRWTRQI